MNEETRAPNPVLQYDGFKLSLAAILRHLASRVEDGDPTALMALGDLADGLRKDAQMAETPSALSSAQRPCPRCGGLGNLPASITTTDQDSIHAELTRDAWDRLLFERDELRGMLDEAMTALRESADVDRKLKEAMLGFYKREQRKAQTSGSDEPPRLGGPPIWPEKARS